MSSTTFDSLGYYEKLKEAGFSDEQARVQANAMREVIEERLATKADLQLLEDRLTSEMQKMELRITLKLGGMMAAAVTVVAALVKLL